MELRTVLGIARWEKGAFPGKRLQSIRGVGWVKTITEVGRVRRRASGFCLETDPDVSAGLTGACPLT